MTPTFQPVFHPPDVFSLLSPPLLYISSWASGRRNSRWKDTGKDNRKGQGSLLVLTLLRPTRGEASISLSGSTEVGQS